MNERDWSWFLERGRVVGGEPIADRRPQLLKRTVYVFNRELRF